MDKHSSASSCFPAHTIQTQFNNPFLSILRPGPCLLSSERVLEIELPPGSPRDRAGRMVRPSNLSELRLVNNGAIKYYKSYKTIDQTLKLN
ncbi:hypothetical protein PoB_002134000 [Plakobranchus ocellatus]|uniref:Uncharacterized protein n=1 Tax=Plakobranchus ocellatus TaxID=259542 RepID=A0AAV3ZGU7_9GAST|nr:hypothetical protein PoB_002134000 [Plakobranchus ocellatus]